MTWRVRYTDEYRKWYDTLSEGEQDAIDRDVDKLQLFGPHLGRPHVDHVKGSEYGNMKELRSGETLRSFFAFDPQRSAALLIGGDKENDKKFYDRMIPIADRIYTNYLEQLESEGELSCGNT